MPRPFSPPLAGGLLAAILLGLLGSPGTRAQPPAARPAPSATPLPRPTPLPPGMAPKVVPAEMGLPDLVRLTLERNPRLAQAAFAIDAAAGRALQAGLYPNPTLVVTGDELGDRFGPGGIWTAPYASQEIVTGGKLKLSRAAALKEVDQATLALLTERYAQLTAVRQGYFEVLAVQRRLDILAGLVELAERSVETTEKLLEAKQVAELDVIQLRVELDRFKADQAAAERERAAAFRRLAATVGALDLPDARLLGSLEAAIPAYEFDPLAKLVLEVHPERRSAVAGVERARLLVRRAEVEPIPNVTVGAGYVRQNQNQSSDWTLSVSVPVPVWNRNQGNIRANQAELAQAVQGVRRVENELVNRLAAAFGRYGAARERAERYRTSILPNAQRAYQLSLAAYRGGQFEYLRVLQAQRSVGEANLVYNQALAEVWQAASEIAGLTLQEVWPPEPPAAKPADRPPAGGKP